MSLFSKLSDISRRRKLELFNRVFLPGKQTHILDIGAEINPNSERGLQLIDSYHWKRNITAVNNSPDHISLIKEHYPQINAVVADGRELPWPDKYFDIVYCNAVIEHLSNFEEQRKMASEIMRVSKQWFVTTPNRWYPFEFHLRLPVVTWFGGDVYRHIARIVSYDHIRRKYTLGGSKAEFRLMTDGELKHCFSNSLIVKQRVTFMAETLIAIGRKA